MRSGTVRLTVAQAKVRFLSQHYSERDGAEHKLIEGCFGIFGHGNLSGLGQALLEAELFEPSTLPYYQRRNEQALVHAATAFARMRNGLSTLVCTSSIGRAPPTWHRRGTGDNQPIAGAAAARRHVRRAGCHACPPGAGAPAGRRRDRE